MSDSHSHDAFVELLSRHRGQLFGFIYALVRRLDDAEDIYQDTALVMWSKFREYEPETNFLGWACTIARYRAANFLKSERRRRRYFSQAVQEELAALQASISPRDAGLQQEALVDCMERLPESDRRLVELCYGGGESFRQVAERLGRSPQSVYDALCRIRRVLFKCIARAAARQRRSQNAEGGQ
ncbi:MAG: sigma-70 family RNA polymerase sigma factor [Pirellulales bacterium]|nr:sigma-70 family RNA polymerase sigma factor [Pirellulales bacterium]